MPKPIPFSSTWNVQSKVALKTIKELQKGIRFHNGFLHWRQAGDEVRTQLSPPFTLPKILTSVDWLHYPIFHRCTSRQVDCAFWRLPVHGWIFC
jgi:hypothetical protein